MGLVRLASSGQVRHADPDQRARVEGRAAGGGEVAHLDRVGPGRRDRGDFRYDGFPIAEVCGAIQAAGAPPGEYPLAVSVWHAQFPAAADSARGQTVDRALSVRHRRRREHDRGHRSAARRSRSARHPRRRGAHRALTGWRRCLARGAAAGGRHREPCRALRVRDRDLERRRLASLLDLRVAGECKALQPQHRRRRLPLAGPSAGGRGVALLVAPRAHRLRHTARPAARRRGGCARSARGRRRPAARGRRRPAGSGPPEDEDPPGAPVALLPEAEAHIVSDSVTLECTPLPGATRYHFEVENFLEGRQTWVAYYTWSDPVPRRRFWPVSSARYRWRVRATTDGPGAPSSWRRFDFERR